jgi:hypothetical protein
MVENREFRRFHRLLTAEKNAKRCYDCYLYRVTATLVGRFDTVDSDPCPGDAQARCCGFGNFGHFGLACGRLVIQRVTQVEAKYTVPGFPEHTTTIERHAIERGNSGNAGCMVDRVPCRGGAGADN